MALLAAALALLAVAVVLAVLVGDFLGLSAGALLAGIAAALPEWRHMRPRR